MLPNASHQPAGFAELSIRVTVPLTIRPKFRRPPLRIRLWKGLVNRATMPKAAVDENGDFRPDKDDVCSTSHSWENRSVNSEPQASRVQSTSNRDLGARVTAPSGFHTAKCLLR